MVRCARDPRLFSQQKDVFYYEGGSLIEAWTRIMMAKMSILCPFLGEIISGDQGKLPHCPRVRSDPAPASSKSPLLPLPSLSSLPVSQDTSGGREGGGTSAPSFRVTCPLKCHGAHQPAFLFMCTLQCAHCTQESVESAH